MIEDIRTFSNDIELISQRRRQISQCAAQLFATKGYDATSVQEIAHACMMSVGNLYRYIGSKEDILYLVIDELAQGAEWVIEQLTYDHNCNTAEAIRRLIKMLYFLYHDKQDATMLIYHETRNLAPKARQRCFDIEKRLISKIGEILTRGCEKGEFQIQNIPLMAHTIVTIGQMWAVRRWFLKTCCSVDEYIEQQTNLILRGICKEGTRKN